MPKSLLEMDLGTLEKIIMDFYQDHRKPLNLGKMDGNLARVGYV